MLISISASAFIALCLLSFAGWKLVYALEYATKDQFAGIVITYGIVVLLSVAALVVLVMLIFISVIASLSSLIR